MPIQMDSKSLDDSPIPITRIKTTRMAAVCQSLARAALQTNDVMQVFDMAVADVGEVLNVDMVRIYILRQQRGDTAS